MDTTLKGISIAITQVMDLLDYPKKSSGHPTELVEKFTEIYNLPSQFKFV